MLLYFGGTYLVRGAAALATRFGVPPLVAGLTVVAFGTSAPELAVTLDAALEGYNDIAVGNVVGSNICNLTLILGISALISPVRVDPRLLRIDIPVMVASSALVLLVLADDFLSRPEGMLLLVGITAYIAMHVWIATRLGAGVVAAESAVEAVRSAPLVRDLAFVLVGLVALAGGGYFVVHGGAELATALGASDAMIGLTVTALGTCLPELSTVIAAARHSHGDMAVGNVIGSNIFNALAILGVTSTVQPLSRGNVGWDDLAIMMAVAIVIVPLAVSGRRLGRSEGAMLLLGYVAYSWWTLVP